MFSQLFWDGNCLVSPLLVADLPTAVQMSMVRARFTFRPSPDVQLLWSTPVTANIHCDPLFSEKLTCVRRTQTGCELCMRCRRRSKVAPVS